MISGKYKVVYMPAYVIVSDETKQRLEEYVKNGGTLVLTYRSGIKDIDNNMVTQTMPGQLRELAGITLTEFDSSPVSTKLSNGFGEAKLWRDIIEPETAQTVVSYESEFYSGTPAVTMNEFGKGKVWYIP